MSQYAHEERDPIRCLVKDYEKMLRSGNVGFLDANYFVEIIDYYQENNLLKDALQAVDCALEQHAYSADFHIRKAQLLMSTDMEDEAIGCLETAESLDASVTKIFILKAELFAALGDQGQSLAALERAQMVATEDEYVDIYLTQATIHEESYDYERAFQSLKSALVVQPTNEDALSRIWFAVELTSCYL